MGSHVVRTWASTQTIVALSSGEAEFYSLVKGACEGLGLAGLAVDLGMPSLHIEIATDSSAAKGIACRRGVGRVKHLETRCLWIQDQTSTGRVRVRKVPGESNTADLLTKYLGPAKLAQLMAKLAAGFEPGRSQLIPELHGPHLSG